MLRNLRSLRLLHAFERVGTASVYAVDGRCSAELAVPGLLGPGTFSWWRRGDSTSAAFAAGWTMPSSVTLPELSVADAERVIRIDCIEPDPSARPGRVAFGESMSLYRAGLKLAFFLPLGVAMPLALRQAPSGFTDVSSVFSHFSRSDATH